MMMMILYNLTLLCTSTVAFVAGVGTVVFLVTAELERDAAAIIALKASSGTVGVRLLLRCRHTRPVVGRVDGHAVRTAAVTLQHVTTFGADDETEVRAVDVSAGTRNSVVCSSQRNNDIWNNIIKP